MWIHLLPLELIDGANGTPVPKQKNSGGYNDMGGKYAYRRRTEQQLDEDRARFGISRKAAIVIERVAESQADSLDLDEKARRAELKRALQLAELELEAQHLAFLSEYRERLIAEEIAARIAKARDEQDTLLLILLAATQ